MAICAPALVTFDRVETASFAMTVPTAQEVEHSRMIRQAATLAWPARDRGPTLRLPASQAKRGEERQAKPLLPQDKNLQAARSRWNGRDEHRGDSAKARLLSPEPAAVGNQKEERARMARLGHSSALDCGRLGLATNHIGWRPAKVKRMPAARKGAPFSTATRIQIGGAPET